MTESILASTLVFGFVNSVVLMLTALGFSLTFGLSGVANFAHGGLYLLSGFLAWLLIHELKFPFPLAVLTRSFDFGAEMHILMKDIDLAIAQGENLGVPMWVCQAARLAQSKI